MAGKLLTVRETAEILGISEKEVIDAVEEGKIPAYRIAGEFLRFQKEQIDRIKSSYQPHRTSSTITLREKVSEFLYFNDFYIVTFTIITVLIFLVFRQY
ncbi:helix-turn-helix domain-containing protein [Candidatus Omnitrophota bacterium]